MPEIIEFDDVSIRLDMLAVIGHTMEDSDGFSFMIQTAFGKMSKHSGKTYDSVEKFRTELLDKIREL